MTGRPTLYDPKMDEQAYKLCLLGATLPEIAEFFDVAESTVSLWMTQHDGFSGAITRGRTAADANVASRLYERAMGYSHPEVHVTTCGGEVVQTPLTKHYPPDTQAASLWLRNRQPKKWRDRQEVTGADGGPIQTEEVGAVDLARRVAFVLAKGKAELEGGQ